MLSKQEKEFIDYIDKSGRHDEDIAKELIRTQFSQCTDDFLNHKILKQWLESDRSDDAFKFWYLASFIQKTPDESEMLQDTNSLKLFLDEIFGEEYQEDKKQGRALLPSLFANNEFIQKLYGTENQTLITLIEKYIPLPRSQTFEEGAVPTSVLSREKEISKSIKKFVGKQNINNIEKDVIKIQRKFRAQKRIQEEEENITGKQSYGSHGRRTNKPDDVLKQEAKALMKDANTPYRPKCSAPLARRIIKIAQSIELHPTIRHLTSKDAVENIFNDSLKGRRTLLESYLPFKPAALDSSDISRGDADVICFGPNDIDPKAVNEIEIVLNVKKVIADKPMAFYKVKDLGFNHQKIHTVNLNNKELNFSATASLRTHKKDHTEFAVYDQNSHDPKYYAQLHENLMIAYDLENMNQIYALNFFRFIDNLKNLDGSDASPYIADFYKNLEQMNDADLRTFIIDASTKLTDTAEFNFYGSYKLDFTTIETIGAGQRGGDIEYRLNLNEFIQLLNTGNLQELPHAQKNIENLFKSYRFLDYLIDNTTHSINKQALMLIRKDCDVPDWLDNTAYKDLDVESLTKDVFEARAIAAAEDKVAAEVKAAAEAKVAAEVKAAADVKAAAEAKVAAAAKAAAEAKVATEAKAATEAKIDSLFTGTIVEIDELLTNFSEILLNVDAKLESSKDFNVASLFKMKQSILDDLDKIKTSTEPNNKIKNLKEFISDAVDKISQAKSEIKDNRWNIKDKLGELLVGIKNIGLRFKRAIGVIFYSNNQQPLNEYKSTANILFGHVDKLENKFRNKLEDNRLKVVDDSSERVDDNLESDGETNNRKP